MLSLPESLNYLAFTPESKDRVMTAQEKQRELSAIEELMSKDLGCFNASHLPELLYLEQRVIRLQASTCPLSQKIKTFASQLRQKSISRGEAIDELLIQLSNLSLQATNAPTEKKRTAALRLLEKTVQDTVKSDEPGFTSTWVKRLYSQRRGSQALFNIVPIVRVLAKHAAPSLYEELINQNIDVARLASTSQADKPLSPAALFLLETASVVLLKLKIDTLVFDQRNGCTLSSIPQKAIRGLKAIITRHAENKAFEPIVVEMCDNKGNVQALQIPLHFLAVLLDDKQLLQTLIQAGISPRAADLQGFQAIHIAAILGNLGMIEALVRLGADIKAETKQGATIFDFLKALGFGNREPNTPTKFLSSNIYTQDTLLSLWQMNHQPHSFDPSEALVEEEVFREFVAIQNGKPFTSPFHLRKVAPPSPLAGEIEACASRLIRAGEYVAEYTGHVEFTNSTRLKYSASLGQGLQVNAEQGGSFAEFINHGAPNVAMITVVYKGFPHVIMYTLTDIPEGAPLICSYSYAYFNKLNIPTYELNPSLVEDFVKSTKELQFLKNGARVMEGQAQLIVCYIANAQTEHVITLPLRNYSQEMQKTTVLEDIFTCN